jgi:hypothetical protein
MGMKTICPGGTEVYTMPPIDSPSDCGTPVREHMLRIVDELSNVNLEVTARYGCSACTATAGD